MSLSEYTRQALINKGLHTAGSGQGHELLDPLGIDRDSAIADFFTHVTGVDYEGVNHHEIDDHVWFIENTSYLKDRKSRLSSLGLSDNFIPLDSFKGGGGCFYNTSDGGVYDIELGEPLRRSEPEVA